MRKSKNGSIDPMEAATMWRVAYLDADAVTDDLGTVAKYKERVAVKKADLRMFRDSTVKAQGYTMTNKAKQATSQEDIDKLDSAMRGQANWKA